MPRLSPIVEYRLLETFSALGAKPLLLREKDTEALPEKVSEPIKIQDDQWKKDQYVCYILEILRGSLCGWIRFHLHARISAGVAQFAKFICRFMQWLKITHLRAPILSATITKRAHFIFHPPEAHLVWSKPSNEWPPLREPSSTGSSELGLTFYRLMNKTQTESHSCIAIHMNRRLTFAKQPDSDSQDPS